MAGINNLKPWPKGVSGNPAGRYALPEGLKGIRSLNQTEVTAIISKYARMTYGAIEDCLEDDKLSVMDKAICSIFIETIKKGDCIRLAFLLDRAIGKAPIIEQDIDEEYAELAKLPLKDLLHLIQNNLPEEK